MGLGWAIPSRVVHHCWTRGQFGAENQVWRRWNGQPVILVIIVVIIVIIIRIIWIIIIIIFVIVCIICMISAVSSLSPPLITFVPYEKSICPSKGHLQGSHEG